MGLAADLQGKLQLAPGHSAASPGLRRSLDFPAALPGQAPAAQPAAAASGGARPAAAAASPARPAGPWAGDGARGGRASPARSPGHSAAAAAAQQEEPWQTEAVEQLAQLHPWAGSELVSAVLSAVCYDLDTGGAILRDMAAAPGEGCAAGGDSSSVQWCSEEGDWSAESSSSGSEAEASRDQPEQQQAARWPGGGDDFVVAGEQVARQKPRLVSAAADAAAGPWRSADPPLATAQRQLAAPEPTLANLRPPPATGGALPPSAAAAAAPASDLYWRHRTEVCVLVALPDSEQLKDAFCGLTIKKNGP